MLLSVISVVLMSQVGASTCARRSQAATRQTNITAAAGFTMLGSYGLFSDTVGLVQDSWINRDLLRDFAVSG
jgi:hypothetical protein